ncbi:YifB family Mg chelatase-like AAA ATPase [Anaerosphaera multitolerans]|uniref:ATP-binding protein n=1 Tax=Anaerosphaera multitolerans TaxID=2487351 RepID=A0A437S840_9FIRM|nr:YifB family Mg chelatase-like AAA ATPase [Anaerosphaera multitolerans]RVU55243.1 ATP-binding protein [Anaerosphaera multitolerans]
MYSYVNTCSLTGLDGELIEVEADLSNGLPKFTIVGLPDIAIRESMERVRSGIKNSAYEFPLKRITINLAPANLKKDGSQFDLAIAVAILTANGTVNFKDVEDFIILGELSLDGSVNKVTGALPMVISLRERGFKKFIIPEGNKKECSVISDVEIYPVLSLQDVVNFLNGDLSIDRYVDEYYYEEIDYNIDFSDIKGQEFLKRALEVAAAGKHNILIIGTPGSGKSMAAKRFPTILPMLNFKEAIEVTKIYSIANLLTDNKLITQPPFRSPHHTASAVSLIGGGRIPKPGEISLAHNGVLFLDELPEFSKQVLEVLRQPLEDETINIARANASLSYPAKFILVAAMNPCPCGYYGDPYHQCKCSMNEINRYLLKISHPLLDRIDIHIEVSPVKYDDMSVDKREESSKSIRERVEHARNIQKERFKDIGIYTNSEIRENQIHKYCKLNQKCKTIMDIAFKKFRFSARTYNKILKVSRTIADLDGNENIEEQNILEAIRFRSVDLRYWG